MKRLASNCLAGLVLALAAQPLSAADWRLNAGVHDFVVPDMDSHTPGLGAGISGKHLTQTGTALSGYVDVYWDRDKDKLDPDHIPIWFRSAFLARGRLYDVSPASRVNWLLDLRGKRNTVSSVEKQFKMLPGLSFEYSGASLGGSVSAFLGLYYLEIDDDVPKTRGYGRSDYGHGTGAYSVMLDGHTRWGDGWRLSGVAQHWGSDEAWLENQYKLELAWHEPGTSDREYILSGEYTEYNIDVYAKVDLSAPDYVPILPWNSDLILRAYVSIPWPF